ncbi:MAG: hypothetical protein M1393_04185 [Candidatus Thermoplasmatota archaeon]|nr:hypothetical protein [Candidatus Thermoplasmatota archaeon]
MNDANRDCNGISPDDLLKNIDNAVEQEMSAMKDEICKLVLGVLSAETVAKNELFNKLANITDNVSGKLGTSDEPEFHALVERRVHHLLLKRIFGMADVNNWIKDQATTIAKDLSRFGALQITISFYVGIASVSVTFDVKQLLAMA